MKKIATIILTALLAINAYAVTATDLLAFPFYNSTYVTGTTAYSNLNDEQKLGDFNLNIKAAGPAFGIDLLFTDNVGLYIRAGMPIPFSVKRSIANYEKSYTDMYPFYQLSSDIGAVFALPVGEYFSVCAAPAFSVLLITASKLDVYSSDINFDSVIGIGPTIDLYGKMRFKHLVMTAGSAFTYMPNPITLSADLSEVTYENPIRTNGFNIRPYISIGFSFKDDNDYSVKYEK